MKKILLFVLAVMLVAPVLASAADKLPAGFIVLSESRMNWNDAKAFCLQKSGKLPRINNSDKWDGENPPLRGILIDGFGYEARPWAEVGLLPATYWTGTEDSSSPGFPWFVVAGDGGARVGTEDEGNEHRVVCVP